MINKVSRYFIFFIVVSLLPTILLADYAERELVKQFCHNEYFQDKELNSINIYSYIDNNDEYSCGVYEDSNYTVSLFNKEYQGEFDKSFEIGRFKITDAQVNLNGELTESTYYSVTLDEQEENVVSRWESNDYNNRVTHGYYHMLENGIDVKSFDITSDSKNTIASGNMRTITTQTNSEQSFEVIYKNTDGQEIGRFNVPPNMPAISSEQSEDVTFSGNDSYYYTYYSTYTQDIPFFLVSNDSNSNTHEWFGRFTFEDTYSYDSRNSSENSSDDDNLIIMSDLRKVSLDSDGNKIIADKVSAAVGIGQNNSFEVCYYNAENQRLSITDNSECSF